MIQVGAYFSSQRVARAALRELSLPTGLLPTHFGADERGPSAANRVAAAERYERFLERKTDVSYFLYAQRCRYDLMPWSAGQSFVTVDPLGADLDDAEAELIFAALANARYRFAADVAEYHHRNRVSRRFGTTVVESWLGRDIERYVPGLYWRTGISNDLALQHGVYSLASPLGGDTTRNADGSILVRMRGPAAAWQNWARDLDAFCASVPGIFSYDRIRRELDKAWTHKGFSDRADNWR